MDAALAEQKQQITEVPCWLTNQCGILTTEVFQENTPNGTSGDACGFTFSLQELICK